MRKCRHLVSDVVVGILLLGSVVFIGIYPPVGMVLLAMVLFS